MDEKNRQSVLRTLAYFDIFDYPLTREDVRRYCYSIDFADYGDDYTDLLIHLEQIEQLQQIQHKNGFYFLSGREANIAARQDKVKIVEQKMKVAVRGIKKIRWAPFVRAVFVCNTVAGAVVEENSDIDVFIVARAGRIWLARALVTLTLCLFGLRRTKRKIKNRICLSFYVTDDSLNLEKIAIEDDIYLKYWLAQLIPVYDPDNLLAEIQRANVWASKSLPNAFVPFQPISRWQVKNSRWSIKIKRLLEKMWGSGYGDLMEAQARGMQKARMALNYMSAQNEPDTRVVINDKMLKFHENDRREEYGEEWEKRVKNLLNLKNPSPRRGRRGGGLGECRNTKLS
ncbi:MAG: hypothetical protein HY980_03585 [Candidatus Magasanikbacteria bacterium]|nr:hypothetical protein [Candidatus Magasanikbacteria bacterium]